MNADTSIADATIPSPSASIILPSHSFTRGAVSAYGIFADLWGVWERGDPRPTTMVRAILMLPSGGCFLIGNRKMHQMPGVQRAGYPTTVHEICDILQIYFRKPRANHL